MNPSDLLTRDDLELVVSALRSINAKLEALAREQRAQPVSLDVAASHFGVSRRTIQRWIKSGEIPVVRVGGTVRVNLDASHAHH